MRASQERGKESNGTKEGTLADERGEVCKTTKPKPKQTQTTKH